MKEEESMLCKKCGAELKTDEKFCGVCGTQTDAEVPMAEEPMAEEPMVEAPAEPVTEETLETTVETSAEEIVETSSGTAVEETVSEIPAEFIKASVPEAPAKSNKGIIVAIVAIVAIAVIVAAAALTVIGIGPFSRKEAKKDPKQVVIDAFKTVNQADEVSPMEELFGWSEMPENLTQESSDVTFAMKLDSCSVAELNAFAGAGLRMVVKSDIAAQTSFLNIAALYQDMDLANLDIYVDDETLMMAVPELSSKVFTLVVDDTLAERVKNSPVLGPIVESSGMDMDAYLEYIDTLVTQMENQEETGAQNLDLKTLMKRYKEGCKAQDNFKAAMEVEVAESSSFTIDGEEVDCKGYDVLISKDSMIEFLRTSSDFFLQDEELKEAYLKQLEATVKMSEIMGGSSLGMNSSASDMMQQSYEEVEQGVDQMIEFLDKCLNDVEMTVYVDKEGRLAAVDGTTVIAAEAEAGVEAETVKVKFNWELQGGTYLTQNMSGKIVLINESDERVTVDFTQVGTYDKNDLTYELEMNAAADGETASFVYKGDYASESGSYNIRTGMTASGEMIFEIDAKGVVDELEKGKWIHASLDELKFSIIGAPNLLTMSGEWGIEPLSGTLEAPAGQPLDILAATEEDWQGVYMEAMIKLDALMRQLGMY